MRNDQPEMNRDSQRSAKGRVFEMLDHAIEDVGMDFDADFLYSTCKGALLQGRRWPWFRVNERKIMETEGGYDNATLAVAGMALARMSPGMAREDRKQAILDASEDYRSQLHKQWNIKGTDSVDQHPVSMALGFPDMYEGEEEGSVLDFPEEKPEPRPEFDPHNIKDPRLRKVWPHLTQGQRDLLTHYADTDSLIQAGEFLNLSSSGTNGRVKRARETAVAVLESDK